MMISEVLVAEMKKVVICVFAVERAHSRRDIMPVNARNCVKDPHSQLSFFLFALFLLVLLQQVFSLMPVNQIIISSYN